MGSVRPRSIIHSAVSKFLDVLDVGLGQEDQVKRKIMQIEADLWELESLKDVEAREQEERRLLARDIIDLGSRFQNLLEAFIIKSGGEADQEYNPDTHGARCFYLKRWSLSDERAFSEIAIAIKKLKRRKDRISVNLNPIFAVHRTSFLMASDQNAAGRKEEMEQLVSFLCSDEEVGAQVISISGIEGMTALAQELFDHPDVRNYYTFRVWVKVGPKFDRDSVLQNILRQVGREGALLSSMHYEEELVREVLLSLEREGILVVLDDICSLDDLVSLRFWSNQSSRGKILITTRMNEEPQDSNWGAAKCVQVVKRLTRRKEAMKERCVQVRRLMGMTEVPQNSYWGEARYLQLSKYLTLMDEVPQNSSRRLTEDEGCKLLMSDVPGPLVGLMKEDLAKKIVNYCGGVSSTIDRFLGCLSMEMLTFEGLKQLLTKRPNSVSSNRLEKQEIQTTLQALASSYHKLPHFLQSVFLYMGVLQQGDPRVEVEKLCLLSLVDGLLEPLQSGKKKLVHIAESHVTEIAKRSLVDLDEGEEASFTTFKYCQLSEIMLDLSLFKNKHEGFINVVDFASGSHVIPVSSASWARFRTVSRVAVNLDDYEEGFRYLSKKGEEEYRFPIKDVDTKHIRVLLFSTKKNQVWPLKFPSLTKFKYLRVLDFDGFNFQGSKLARGIESAVHLRYLSFKDCILGELPSWVGNLKLLYVLDLRVRHSTTMFIPNVLWNLKKLRHLCFPLLYKTIGARKLRLDSLTELETITNFNTSMLNVEDLFDFRNLQYVDFNVVGNHLEEINTIIRFMLKDADSDLCRTSVKISNFDCYSEDRHFAVRQLLACQFLKDLCIEGHMHRLPTHHNISGNLTTIVFIESELIQDPMSTLKRLPKLRVLVLDDAFTGEEIVCPASGFAELKLLELVNFRYLKKCIVEDGAVPKLSTLAIGNCPRLESLAQHVQPLRVDRSLEEAQRFRMVDLMRGQGA